MYDEVYPLAVEVEGAAVDLRALGRALQVNGWAKLLEHAVNGMELNISAGFEIGKLLTRSHRYLQAQVIMSLLAIVAALGDQKEPFIDPRNAHAVSMARTAAKATSMDERLEMHKRRQEVK